MRVLSKIDCGADRLKLSPEVRLGLALAASLAALALSDPVALAVLTAASLVYVFLQIRLKVILIAYAVFGLMVAVALACAWLLGFVFTAMKGLSPALVIIPFARLAISVNLILPLAFQASLSGLAGTMNRLRLPGIIKLPLLVTIRFIPSFINDLLQLRQAVRLRFRGRGGFIFWLRRPLLWWRVFFLPLVVRLIRSADELAVASELKGLSAETDLGSAPLTLKKTDRLVLLSGAAVLGLSSIWQVFYAGG